MKITKTFLPKDQDLNRQFYLIDAGGKILGRIAARAATILRGKHKRIFTPNMDTGDSVVIINAAKVRVTGKKMQDKIYQQYSGYPAGQKCLSLEQLLAKSPEQVIRLAVNRMIPRGALGNQVRGRLRVYAGDKHPHGAQKLIPLEIT